MTFVRMTIGAPAAGFLGDGTEIVIAYSTLSEFVPPTSGAGGSPRWHWTQDPFVTGRPLESDADRM